jgi:hypothetical protein
VPDVISGLGKPANLIVALLAACSVGAAVNLRAAAGQVVVRPAIEQGYIEVQYPVHAGDATAGSGRSVTVRLPLCNQVDPVFRVRVRPQAGYLVYEYELANGPRAKEPIQSFKRFDRGRWKSEKMAARRDPFTCVHHTTRAGES